MFFRLLISTLLSVQLYAGAIENSVIPLIEKYECLENLPAQKYSQNQFQEIRAALEQKNERIRLASFNMLFTLYDHNLAEVNRWPQRLPRIVKVLDSMQPDIIGVQELYEGQVKDLLGHIGDTYSFYARQCSDGEQNGILYRKDRFEVLDHHVWYMTETPEIPSSETLTMLQLRDRLSGKCVAIFNAHLAFSKINKRDFQARFVAKQVAEYAQGMPCLFTGDLNTFSNRLDLEKLPALDGDYVHRILTQSALKDSQEVSILGHFGPISTFTNAEDDIKPFVGHGTPGIILDHIYVTKNVTVLVHAVEPATVDGHFPSDHMPVVIDFVLCT